MLLRRHVIHSLMRTSSSGPPTILRPAVLHTCRIIRAYHRPTITTRIAELQASRPTTRRGFEIAIICALPLEADAVDAVFDLHWDDDGPPFDKALGDPNAYSTGAIGRHNVVLAHMPGMGKATAAAVAAHCRASFPNIKLALVVGVCGVVPFGPGGEEIMLGDVVISDGVVQYDFGRRLANRFVRKDTLVDSLGRPNAEIRGLLAKLRGLRGRKLLGGKMVDYLSNLQLEPGLGAEPPGTATDKASASETTNGFIEEEQSSKRRGVNGKQASSRRDKTVQGNRKPTVHFGLIASGDSVIKSGKDRDAIATAEGVIAFEMEGAGIWENLPCVVIKGACDYADSYKNKDWQRYAAATAAACAKAFLSYWVPSFTPGAAAEESDVSRDSVYCIPYPKNGDFVERTDIANVLKDMLLTDLGSQQVALAGLGGIGKTQLALHLAHWVKENKPEYSVLWIPAFNMASFEEACKGILKAFDIRYTEKEDAKKLVRDYLSSEEAGPWFLVIDNADDMGVLDGILDFLPQSENGRILLTTRSQEVAVTAAGSAVVRLPEMSKDEAVAFLETSLIDKAQLHDKDIVGELLEKLTNLPLAIAQAAAYLNMNQVSIKEYLRLFSNTDQDMIELLSNRFRNNTHYFNTQGAIATTWIISFNQIRDLNDTATRLLSYLGCIEPKAIPRSLLPTLETEQKMTRAIGILCGYGFLSQRGDEGMFDMHSLVHLAARIWSEGEGDLDSAHQDVLTHLARVYPTDERENQGLWRQYAPHALKVLKSRRAIGRDYCMVGLWTTRCLAIDGRTQEAAELLQQIVAIQETMVALDDPHRLWWKHELGRAYHTNGQTEEAIELLEHVVAVRDATLEVDDERRLASQHQLAQAYQVKGQFKKAMQLQEHVVRIEEKAFPEAIHSRLVSHTSLAYTYEEDGQLERAIKLLEQAVAIYEATLAADHPDRLETQHQLARVYQANGQTREAIRLLELQTEIITSRHAREAFLMEQVRVGEVLAEGNNGLYADTTSSTSIRQLDSALAFFKALKIYPNPKELVRIYSTTVPQPILTILYDIINQDSSLDIHLAPASTELEDMPNQAGTDVQDAPEGVRPAG